jgi:polysaccharide export outer membrane protein
MLSQSIGRYNTWRACWCLPVVISCLAMSASGQIGKQSQAATPMPSEKAVSGDYILGPGDIVTITVADSPELSGRYRVGENGQLNLPSISTPIRAWGLTAVEVAKRIAEALKASDLLRDPVVNVFLEEYHSRNVTVLGAVAKPSVYPLERPTTVLEVLSLAGGLIPQSGNTLTLVRNSSRPESATSAPTGDSTLTIDLAKLMQGKDPSLNLEVHPGDVISVSPAPVIYVVGAVTKPGGFVLQDPGSGVTVLQALAMAEGLKSVAARSRTLLVRRSAGLKERQEIPINLDKLMAGKIRDQYMEPNDILFVPESGSKKTAQAMARTAEQAAVGIATYGVGLRVGRY